MNRDEEDLNREISEFVHELKSEGLAEVQKARRKIIVRIIFSLIFYAFGIVLVIMGIFDKLVPMIVVGALLCGVFTGAASVKIVDGGFWMKAFFFIIGVVFGIIATPIRVIADIVKLKTNDVL